MTTMKVNKGSKVRSIGLNPRCVGNFSLGVSPRVSRMCCLFLSVFLCVQLSAQDINLTFFGQIPFAQLDLDYNINRKLLSDYAVILLNSNKSVEVDADIEVVKKEKQWTNNHGNTTILYVSPETKTIIVNYKDWPSFYYELPIELNNNSIYIAEIEVMRSKGATSLQPNAASADIRLSEFRLNPQVLLGSSDPVYDNAGQACAVIRYFINDENFLIEPNLGTVKTIKKPGQIIQYVPVGTKRLTVRNGNYMPLSGYQIPVEIETKATYDVSVSLLESAIKRQKASPDLDIFLGVGYNGMMKFSADVEKLEFSIICNSYWDISAPSWCRLSESSGKDNMVITVYAKKKPSNQKRTGLISIQAGDVTATINIEQKGFM